jgi:hypothetical protein
MNDLEKILNDVGHQEVYQKLKEVGITSTEKLRLRLRMNPNILEEYGVEDVVKRDKIFNSIEKNMGKQLKLGLLFLLLLVIFLLFFFGILEF